MARSKVKSRSHHDVADLHPLANVPTKYQLPTPYGFRDTGRTNFFLLPTHPDTIGEKNTLIALKGCGVKNLRQISFNILIFKLNFHHAEYWSSTYKVVYVSCMDLSIFINNDFEF